jgi:hypothetical protein
MIVSVFKHEAKPCPHCRTTFECKAGNITECQCFTVVLTETERAFIAAAYQDCLCASCMRELQENYHRQNLIAISTTPEV